MSRTCPECGGYLRHFSGCPEDDSEPPEGTLTPAEDKPADDDSETYAGPRDRCDLPGRYHGEDC